MDYKLFLCVLVVAVVSSVQARLRITSCLDPATPQLVTVQASVNPDPVVLPGDVTVTLTANVLRNISGSLNLDVRATKGFMGSRIPIPCFQTQYAKLGSCTYRDLCNKILPIDNTRCPRAMTTNKIPCSCPIPAGIYSLPPTLIPVPLKGRNFLSSMIAGEYEARISLTDATSNKELGCYDVQVTVTDPPKPSLFEHIGGFIGNIFGR